MPFFAEFNTFAEKKGKIFKISKKFLLMRMQATWYK